MSNQPYYYPQQNAYQPYGAPQPTYPAGYYQPQPQVIYRDAPRSRGYDTNTCWLISLLTLLCGCCVGEVCCDGADVCCCLIPCGLPRFR
uniref:Cysteine-rich transmembrane CYSTM domain-containing protein n=1 Tax=Panagrolaimus sp. JU765 TaxID=591449 RepID=A0AC34Q2F1_9BILA